MLADWHQDLSCHMSALFGSRRLILNMDTSSSLLDEQLSQLHDCSQTSMSGVSICDDRAEIINVGEFVTVCPRSRCNSFFSLLAVVEELGLEQMLDFVWNGGLGSEISQLCVPSWRTF